VATHPTECGLPVVGLHIYDTPFHATKGRRLNLCCQPRPAPWPTNAHIPLKIFKTRPVFFERSELSQQHPVMARRAADSTVEGTQRETPQGMRPIQFLRSPGGETVASHSVRVSPNSSTFCANLLVLSGQTKCVESKNLRLPAQSQMLAFLRPTVNSLLFNLSCQEDSARPAAWPAAITALGQAVRKRTTWHYAHPSAVGRLYLACGRVILGWLCVLLASVGRAAKDMFILHSHHPSTGISITLIPTRKRPQ
jgi:hypothetical protein